jgi:hypothetical protein
VPELRKKPNNQPVVSISMGKGEYYIPRSEVLVRLNATLNLLEIGQVVDFMALRKEKNGNKVWIARFRLPEEDLPHLFCQSHSRPFSPLAWLTFGSPRPFPELGRFFLALLDAIQACYI